MSVETYFQRRAEQFDALYQLDSAIERWVNRNFRAGLYERADLAATELRKLGAPTVLDVGCGPGRNSVLFANSGASRIVGIDIAPNMISLARSLAQKCAPTAAMEFLCADFLQSSFTGAFDSVIALGFFDYFRDPVPALSKMAALSTKNVIASFPGRSLIRSPFRKFRYVLRGCPVFFYSRDQLARIFAAASLPRHRIISYASSGFLVVAEKTTGAGQ